MAALTYGMASMMVFDSDSYGRVPEVLNGDDFHSCGITRHQCWSETMTVQPTLEGMVGFVPDALANSANLSPRLPTDWKFFRARNLTVGSRKINMEMRHEKGHVRYVLTGKNPPHVIFTPSFTPGTTISSVQVNGID